ncbi:hypothetical protein [Paenibacillus sp. FSL E2-0178]|uniref:hypothetical protein n=1 Tax=Paenibacillus sp. FSL E2-0178 TaxID=2921361 RepID=UPI003158688C
MSADSGAPAAADLPSMESVLMLLNLNHPGLERVKEAVLLDRRSEAFAELVAFLIQPTGMLSRRTSGRTARKSWRWCYVRLINCWSRPFCSGFHGIWSVPQGTGY